MKKKKYLKCFDCKYPAVMKLSFGKVGLCKKCADVLLVSALLVKVHNSQVKKPLKCPKKKTTLKK